MSVIAKFKVTETGQAQYGQDAGSLNAEVGEYFEVGEECYITIEKA